MKQALVTGASRGIGASVALSLAEAGFRIWLHYRTREDAARQVAATIVGRGGPEPILVGFDLADRKAANDAVLALTDQHGAPDAFVLNAGITQRRGRTNRRSSPRAGYSQARGARGSIDGGG